MPDMNEGRFTFKDRFDEEWDLKVTLTEALRVDDSDYSQLTDIPISFLKPSEEGQREIFTNAALQFALIYTIIKPEMSQEQFTSRIDGSCVDDAQWALLRSLVDFFQKQRIVLSPILEAAEARIAKAEKDAPKIEKLVREKIQEANDELDRKLTQAKEKLKSEKPGTPSTP